MQKRNRIYPWLFLITMCFTVFRSVEDAESASTATSAPWLPGEQWKAGGTGYFYNKGDHTGNDEYCVDFNWNGDNNTGDGNYDRGAPILAVADGTVTIAHPWNKDPNSDPLGNRVQINHMTYESRYAHLNTTPIVVKDQVIHKGQVIGFMGSTGNSTGPHLHHCLYQNGISVEPNPMDGQVLSNGALITSHNTNLFDKTYNLFTEGLLGTKDGSPHWYNDWNNTNLYNPKNNISTNIYIQNLNGSSSAYWAGAIVYDALGGARKTYLIRSGFWIKWKEFGGPTSSLGAPLNEEYEYPAGSNHKKARQDFQGGYLIYEQGANTEITPYYFTMPGMYANGWHPDTSYAFAEAYEQNGTAVKLGSPDNRPGETPFVHEWVVNNSKVLIQDFYGGEWVDSAIIYNPNDNNAYVVRTGFWQHYRTKNGPEQLGAPNEDEHGNTIEKPCDYDSCQKFEKGELWWNGNTVIEFSLDCSALGGSIPTQCQTLYKAPPRPPSLF